MYHCHFTQRGRVVLRQNFEVESLPAAVTTGHRILKEMALSQDLDGLEIWEDDNLLYASAGQTHRAPSYLRSLKREW
jgi:hypothetical protein